MPRRALWVTKNRPKTDLKLTPGKVFSGGCAPQEGPNKLINTKVTKHIWGSPKASHIKASHPHFPHFLCFLGETLTATRKDRYRILR